MYARQKLTHTSPIVAVVAMLILVTCTDIASAQIIYPRVAPHSYYHRPIPAFHGPTTLRYSPSTGSFYSVPVVTRPATIAPLIYRPTPLVYSQSYSYLSGRRYAYYPTAFPSYVPGFASTNTYTPVDPLAPYISGTGVAGSQYQPQTMAPYQTPLFFRY